VATTTISLPDDQLERLRRHAEASQRSLDDVVQEALDAYLARLRETPTSQVGEPPATPPNGAWQTTTRTTPDGFRLHIPPDMSPDEAEALLAEPTPEARRKRLAAWLLKRSGGRIIEPPPGPPSPEWQAQFDATLARIHASLPDDMTPEEIEALITEVSEEARQERIARRERERVGG
jgi:hypothetical protein